MTCFVAGSGSSDCAFPGLVLPSCLVSAYFRPGSVLLSKKNFQQSLVFFFMASYLSTLLRETGQGTRYEIQDKLPWEEQWLSGRPGAW